MFVEIQESTTREDVIGIGQKLYMARPIELMAGTVEESEEVNSSLYYTNTKKAAEGYSDIADSLNRTVVRHLREHLQYERATQRVVQSGQIQTMSDLLE